MTLPSKEELTRREVRKAILSEICLSPFTLPHIIDRTRDLADEVRAEAYKIIGDRISVKALTIQQRIELLVSGL